MATERHATPEIALLVCGLLLACPPTGAGEQQAAQDEVAVEAEPGEGETGDGGAGEGEDQEEKDQADQVQVDEGQELLITAPRPEASDPSASSEPIAGERLRQSARPSTIEAISQEVPWVYVSSRGVGVHGMANGASGGISIRGLGGSPTSQVLVVQDGIPDYQGIFGHPLPDAYVPELIERADVVSGGDSVLYGTNAMGGVIALRSRWRTRPGEELHLRASYGSFDSLSVNPAALAHWGAWDVAAAFHGRTSDGHRAGAGGDLQVGQLGARAWLTDQDRVSVWLKAFHLHGADPGPVSHPHPEEWFDALRFNASLAYEHFSDKATWRALAFTSGGRHTLYDGFLSVDWITGAILKGRWQVHPRLELLGGLSLDHVDGSVEDRILAEAEPIGGLTNLALYQQATWRPLDALTLVAGAREVESLRYGFLFLYKLGASVAAWPGGSVRVRWATNFRQPTLRELYLPYPVANPDLEPESSRSLDLGVTQVLGDWLRLELTGFRTEASNLIKYFGSWPSAEVINIDHVVFWGLEGLVRARLFDSLELSLGGTWQEVGRYTKQNPDLKLDGRLRFVYRSLVVSLAAEWIHGLFQNNYERDPIPDAFWMDLDARYLFADAGIAFFVALRNLTDSRYAFIDQYRMPGFNLLAGMEVHL